MKILAISDGHGALDNLHALKPIAENVDLVLFAGDFAAFNKLETGLPFLQELRKLHKKIYAVLGNCDPPAFLKALQEHDMNVQASMQKIEDFVIIGSGGASKFTGATPNERHDVDLASEDRKPILAISGHIHEAYGVDKIGNTCVINPGALCDGRFAIVEIKKDNGKYIATASLETLI